MIYSASDPEVEATAETLGFFYGMKNPIFYEEINPSFRVYSFYFFPAAGKSSRYGGRIGRV